MNNHQQQKNRHKGSRNSRTVWRDKNLQIVGMGKGEKKLGHRHRKYLQQNNIRKFPQLKEGGTYYGTRSFYITKSTRPEKKSPTVHNNQIINYIVQGKDFKSWKEKRSSLIKACPLEQHLTCQWRRWYPEGPGQMFHKLWETTDATTLLSKIISDKQRRKKNIPQ